MSEFINEPPRDCPIVANPLLTYVIVKSELIEESRGIGKDSGKAYCIRKQNAYVYNDGADQELFPEKFSIQLRDGEAPYPKGYYMFLPQSFSIGDFGKLFVNPALQRVASPFHSKGSH